MSGDGYRLTYQGIALTGTSVDLGTPPRLFCQIESPTPTRGDAMTRTMPPNIEFETPPCPICGNETEATGERLALACGLCRVRWLSDGTGGEWDFPDAEQCPAVLAWRSVRTSTRCLLAKGHDGDDYHEGNDATWTDRHHLASVDRHGQPIPA